MTVKHWIGGAPVDGGHDDRIPLDNPATGEQIDDVARADAGVVDRAVAAAAAAQQEWGATSLARRTEVMFRMRELVSQHAEELARVISVEHGKTVADAMGEVARGRETLDFACGINHVGKGDFTADASTGVDVHSTRQPLGVVAGITPFNFPAMVPFWMHPVAIATGNAFVLKPSERVPSASNVVARLYQEAGLPDGVFNVVHGDSATVDAILEHPGIAAVSFVGSTAVARHVQQSAVAHGKRVQALGGANNHAVVLPDADMAFAAGQLAAAAFGSAGERCMAVPVAVAVGAAAEPLVAALRREAERITVGPGDAAGTDMGPVITAAARQRVIDYTTSAVDAGAVAVVDGRDLKVEGYENGHFVGPTLLDRVTTDMGTYCDEVFDLAAMSDEQCAQVRRFVQRGGGVVATGETSRFDEWGDARPDFALADLFGAHATGSHHGSSGSSDPSWAVWSAHTYMRLSPSTRPRDGAAAVGAEAAAGPGRHRVLDGFERTDVLPFAGRLEVVRTDDGAEVHATLVPPFPI